MRRLRTTAIVVIAVSAMGIAPAAASPGVPPPPPPSVPVSVQQNEFAQCQVYEVGGDGPRVAQIEDWKDFDAGDVTVTEIHGFWSFPMSTGDELEKRALEAGTFGVGCGGPVESFFVYLYVPASTSNPSFRVTWATPGSSGAHNYTVDYRVDSHTSVQPWKNHTGEKNAIFAGHHGHTYFFRAVTYIDRDHHSMWSPWTKVVVH